MSLNFVEQIVKDAHDKGVNIVTRFPPEPNGYLHLGHAKSICLNFGLAQTYNGICRLRFDDTNPDKESPEYVESIQRDVKWLRPEVADTLEVKYTSMYFDALYEWAEYLIEEGKAYVDSQSGEELRANRGNVHTPGKDSPFRNRTPEENMKLFHEMRDGIIPPGGAVLRAKIDMQSPNMNMRDPLMYRVLHASHHQTGDKWKIYPIYDYAHGQSDCYEGVTHSICTLEFEAHRELYEWFTTALAAKIPNPSKQTEFARLNLSHTMMSKTKLGKLVTNGIVKGWDDPRMPTISGMRRRGFTSAGIRAFCSEIGVTKNASLLEVEKLYHHVSTDLDAVAPRRMAVIEPLKVSIAGVPDDFAKEVELANHPTNKDMGSRKVTVSPEVYIERTDFQEEPAKDFLRLAPERVVRLRGFCNVRCEGIKKDADGQPVELQCSFVGVGGEGKPKATIHWVNCADAIPIEARLYDNLFKVEIPDAEDSLDDALSPTSLTVRQGYAEASLGAAVECAPFQFERMGYFTLDKDADVAAANFVFNRTLPMATFDQKKKAAKPGKQAAKPAKDADDATAMDLRVGRVVSVEPHPDAESLYVEKIDVGDEAGPRTIVSGLRKYYTVEDFTNKMVIVWANLKPSKLRGVASAGMVLCASKDDTVELIAPPTGAEAGERVTFTGLEGVGFGEKPLSDKLVKRLSPDLHTDADGVVCWKDHKFTVKAGNVTGIPGVGVR